MGMNTTALPLRAGRPDWALVLPAVTNWNDRDQRPGRGQLREVSEGARVFLRGLGRDVEPERLGMPRVVDIRRGFSDATVVARGLGFLVRVSFEHGLRKLAERLVGQAVEDRALNVGSELDARGPTMGGGASS